MPKIFWKRLSPKTHFINSISPQIYSIQFWNHLNTLRGCFRGILSFSIFKFVNKKYLDLNFSTFPPFIKRLLPLIRLLPLCLDIIKISSSALFPMKSISLFLFSSLAFGFSYCNLHYENFTEESKFIDLGSNDALMRLPFEVRSYILTC